MIRKLFIAAITSAAILVLQLQMPSFLVVGDHGLGLMFSPPQRPGEDEGLLCGLSHHEAHDQRSNFGDGGDQGDFAHQAAIAGFGLVSFGLPRAERRRSAPSLARKAAAAMTSVI